MLALSPRECKQREPRRVTLRLTCMSRRFLPLSLLALPVSCLLLTATPAQASCAMPAPMPSAVANAAGAFVGTVTGVDWRGRRATVAVDDIWRGDVSSSAVVLGGPGDERSITSVDRRYRVGGRYLFLPYAKEAGSWRDNACSRTQEYTAALDVLRPSGATRVVTTPATTAPSASAKPTRSKATALGVAVATGAAVTAAVAWIGLRRRREER